MFSLLLNPQGRTLRNRFLQGLVLVTVASVIVTALPVYLGTGFGLLSLLLVYPYICVYAKRFHDAGTTGWWVVVVWLGSMVIQFFVGILFGGFFASEEMLSLERELQSRLGDGDLAGMSAAAERLQAILLPLNILALLIGNFILGLIVASLKTEPRENRHGPVPGTSAGPDTF